VSDEVASGTRILYGGSVKPKNAAELIGQQDIDGFLGVGESVVEECVPMIVYVWMCAVGGASLKADSFGAIIAAAQKIESRL